MVQLKIDELAKLMGKERREIEEMLRHEDVIELNLNERRIKRNREVDDLKIYE